jgi:hypothetical protein
MIDDLDRAPSVDTTLRQLARRACVGYREREPGRLQLQFVLDADEHMHEIVVDEDDDGVEVSATVCSPVSGPSGEVIEGPWHVYLERPLAGRSVVDALSGQEVPHRNVLAELAEGFGLQHGDGAESVEDSRWRHRRLEATQMSRGGVMESGARGSLRL